MDTSRQQHQVERETKLHVQLHLPTFQRPRSLRRKIVLWNVTILFFTLVLLSGVVYFLVTASLVNNLDQRLQIEGERLQNIARLSPTISYPLNPALLKQPNAGQKSNEFASDAPKIKLFDPHSGTVLARSANLTGEKIPFNPADFTAALKGQSVFTTYEDSNGLQARLLTLPLRDGNQRIALVAQISLSEATVEQARESLLLVSSLGTLVATLIAYIIGFFLMGRELRHLRSLSTTMHSLSTQKLDTHIPQQSSIIEVRLLTEAFNEMTQRLEASFALQRNFVGDVSHELRTPLTTLQGQMDVLLLNPDLEEEVRQDVQQMRIELGRLSRLVSNLLMTARHEVGMLPQLSSDRTREVELDALLIAVVRQARFINPEVTLNIRELHQANVTGDTDLLKQLVLNILDNALTYTPSGGKVTITLISTSEVPDAIRASGNSTNQKWAQLSVRDTGSGIDPADLPHIFERHYRSKQASTAGARTSLGSGLGLSIARLIAQVHNGAITVESEPGHGSCFTLWLPEL